MAIRRQPNAGTRITDALAAYLETGIVPDGNDAFAVIVLANKDADLEAVWQAKRDALLAEWLRRTPGTRPWGWWQFSAPRWNRADLPRRCRDLGDDYLRWLCEPRRRVGGTGTRLCEALNSAPVHDFGLPSEGFVSMFQSRYYRGFAKDIHGDYIGQAFRGNQFPYQPYDPNDPPLYESEPDYLLRHGLLGEEEQRRVAPETWQPTALLYGEEPAA